MSDPRDERRRLQEEIRKSDFSTPKDKAVFNSGGDSYQHAQAYCRENPDHKMIGDTKGGRHINNDPVYREWANKSSNPEKYGKLAAGEAKAFDRVNRDMSAKYAKQAEGKTTCFVKDAKHDRVFYQNELPNLRKNEKVTHINNVPREKVDSISKQQGPNAGLKEVQRSDPRRFEKSYDSDMAQRTSGFDKQEKKSPKAESAKPDAKQAPKKRM